MAVIGVIKGKVMMNRTRAQVVKAQGYEVLLRGLDDVV